MNYYVGVDLGGTNIVAGVYDENYSMLAKENRPTCAGRSADDIISDVVQTAKDAAKKAGVSFDQFASIGVGMPSCVNPKTNLLVHSNNLGWKNLPIYEYFARYTDLPVYIENDANCAALGEQLNGAAKGCQDVILLTLGTGVGGGLILNGKLYAGADHMGAELGHIKLVYQGERCTCGQKGCLESYCSATALIRQAKQKLAKDQTSLLHKMAKGEPDRIDGKMIFEAKVAGDELATQVVTQYVDYLTAGISTFITVFRPQIIILGGGIADAGEGFFRDVNEGVVRNTFAAQEIGVPPVVKASLGNDAGILGAAFLGTSR